MSAPLDRARLPGRAITFIVGLKRLSSPATARTGNHIAAVGMLIAIIATLVDKRVASFGAIAVAMVIGAAIGVSAPAR